MGMTKQSIGCSNKIASHTADRAVKTARRHRLVRTAERADIAIKSH